MLLLTVLILFCGLPKVVNAHCCLMTACFVFSMLARHMQFWIPYRALIYKDIAHCFLSRHSQITKFILQLPSHVHIMSDCWTSPNHCAFAAFIAQMEVEGKIVQFIIDFVESHTGQTLVREFQLMLGHFNIQNKVCSFHSMPIIIMN